MSAVGFVECTRNRHGLTDDVGSPLRKARMVGAAYQAQIRIAPAFGDTVLVAGVGDNFLAVVVRAVLEQTVQQEYVEKTCRLLTDADRRERIEVHAAHLDVFNAAFAQRVQWPFAGCDTPLRPDGAVKLVFDLQQRGRQLAVMIAVTNADGRVRRVRLGRNQGDRQQRTCVTLQVVVADRDR